MTQPKKKGPGRPRTPGTVPAGQTLRIQPGNYADIERLAEQWGATRSELVNRAIQEFVRRKLIERDEGAVIPAVKLALEEVLEQDHKRLVTLLVRNGMEILRLQYAMYNFMVEAGIPSGKIETWRDQGRKFARNEYRKRPVTADEQD